MELERELVHRNVYSAVLTPAYRRVKYHFEITGGGRVSACLRMDLRKTQNIFRRTG